MEINYTNSREDIIGFHMRHYTETKSYKKINNVYLNCITFFTILLGIMLLLLKLSKAFNFTISSVIIVTIPFLIIIDIFIILIRQKYIKYIFNLRIKIVYS